MSLKLELWFDLEYNNGHPKYVSNGEEYDELLKQVLYYIHDSANGIDWGENTQWEKILQDEEETSFEQLESLAIILAAFSFANPKLLLRLDWRNQLEWEDQGSFFFQNGAAQAKPVQIDWPQPSQELWIDVMKKKKRREAEERRNE